MELKASLEERVSKKSGNKYTCLVVKLTDTLEKVIFLEPAEIELLNIKQSTTNAMASMFNKK